MTYLPLLYINNAKIYQIKSKKKSELSFVTINGIIWHFFIFSKSKTWVIYGQLLIHCWEKNIYSKIILACIQNFQKIKRKTAFVGL